MTLYGEDSVFFLRTSAIIKQAWLCLLPSHLGNIQASLVLLSVCRQLTVVFFLVARESRSKLRSPLTPSSVDCRLLPSHLGNIQASLVLLSVCRQLTVVFFLVARESRSKLRSPLTPSSVDCRLLPSHLGNIQASLILLSVCRQWLSYSIFFLPLSSLRTGQLSVRNDDRGRPSQKRSPSAQLWKA